jgi:hypothetical protein
MTTLARYVPEDRVIDLSKLGPGDLALITSFRDDRDNRIRPGDRILLCLRPGGGNGEMGIRKVGRNYFAVHFPGGGHPGRHPIVPESDEHKRLNEYNERSVTDAGFTGRREYPVPRGVLDLAVTGGLVDTDLEVQHTDIPERDLRRRTTIYSKAGFLPVWIFDKGARPRSMYRIPSLGCSDANWDEGLPRARSIWATGLTVIEALRCVVGAFDRCPDGQRGPCGRYHENRRPWHGLTLDEAAAMVPAGEIVPLRGRDDRVYLVSPASFALHQELTGGLGEWATGGNGRQRPPRHDTEPCTNPAHDELAAERPALVSRGPVWTAGTKFIKEELPFAAIVKPPGACDTPGCVEPGRLYSGGRRCDTHKPKPIRWGLVTTRSRILEAHDAQPARGEDVPVNLADSMLKGKPLSAITTAAGGVGKVAML